MMVCIKGIIGLLVRAVIIISLCSPSSIKLWFTEETIDKAVKNNNNTPQCRELAFGKQILSLGIKFCFTDEL